MNKIFLTFPSFFPWRPVNHPSQSISFIIVKLSKLLCFAYLSGSFSIFPVKDIINHHSDLGTHDTSYHDCSFSFTSETSVYLAQVTYSVLSWDVHSIQGFCSLMWFTGILVTVKFQTSVHICLSFLFLSSRAHFYRHRALFVCFCFFVRFGFFFWYNLMWLLTVGKERITVVVVCSGNIQFYSSSPTKMKNDTEVVAEFLFVLSSPMIPLPPLLELASVLLPLGF